MATISEAADSRVKPEIRMDLAINALNAVSDLCCEAAHADKTLANVNADNLACLLGLIIDEMRDALSQTSGEVQ